LLLLQQLAVRCCCCQLIKLLAAAAAAIVTYCQTLSPARLNSALLILLLAEDTELTIYAVLNRHRVQCHDLVN
jgi:hypothetical protein